MSLDALRKLNFYVVAMTDSAGTATITIHFGKTPIDLDAGTIAGRDLLATIDALDKKIKTPSSVMEEPGMVAG